MNATERASKRQWAASAAIMHELLALEPEERMGALALACKAFVEIEALHAPRPDADGGAPR